MNPLLPGSREKLKFTHTKNDCWSCPRHPSSHREAISRVAINRKYEISKNAKKCADHNGWLAKAGLLRSCVVLNAPAMRRLSVYHEKSGLLTELTPGKASRLHLGGDFMCQEPHRSDASPHWHGHSLQHPLAPPAVSGLQEPGLQALLPTTPGCLLQALWKRPGSRFVYGKGDSNSHPLLSPPWEPSSELQSRQGGN